MTSVAGQVIPMRGGGDAAKAKLDAELRPSLDKSRIRPVGHDILLAMYNRADGMSQGGIIIPGTNREDEFQGKVAMIVALGPMCCEEESPGYMAWFGGKPPQVGEWWGLSQRDGVQAVVGKTPCRLVEWKYLRFQTQAPDEVI